MLTVGSTFTGVGGIDLGFEQTGQFQTVWMSEVDKHASAVLAHRWPTVPNLGDINAIGTVPTVDVIAGGFPCQDYSVAGNRGGLAGDRGALWWQLHRLMDGQRPTWFVGENVPGLLSSNGGRDFRTIVDSLVDLGYGVVWRVLDSQWFGVAQRRRRVVIVGHSRGRPRPEILAVGQSLSGDPQPSRQAGEDVAGTLEARTRGGGFPETDGAISGHVIPSSHNPVPGPVTASWSRGPNRAKVEGGAVVSVSSSGRDTVGTITRAFDGKNYSNLQEVSVGSLVAFAENQRGELRTTPTANLTTGGGKPGHGYPAVMHGPTVRRLTPLECERLQGFPDHWTATGDYGNGPEPMSDTQRYRQMGNAVTVPVFRWVANRIAEGSPL